MASLIDTAFPSREDYAKQIKNYDAGRPYTPTSTKPGADVYIPNFDPSADAKGLQQRQSLTNIQDKQGRTAAGNIRNFLSVPMASGLDQPDTPIATTMPMSVSPSQPVASNAAPVVERAPLTQSNNAYSGKYAAQDANGQGIYQDPVTGRKSIRLTGDEGNKFMASRMPLTTARPGEGMLSASSTPVERKPLSTSSLAGMNGFADANATDAALFNARMNQIKNSDSMSKPGTAWGDLNQKQLDDFQKNAVTSTANRLAAELDNRRLSAALTGGQLPEERNAAMVDSVQRVRRNIGEGRVMDRLKQQGILDAQQAQLDQTNNQFETSTRLAENRDATDRYVSDQNLARENARGRTELQQEAIKQAGEMKRQGDPTMKARWDAFSKEIEAMRAAQDARADDPDFIEKLKRRYQLSNTGEVPGKVTTETL